MDEDKENMDTLYAMADSQLVASSKPAKESKFSPDTENQSFLPSICDESIAFINVDDDPLSAMRNDNSLWTTHPSEVPAPKPKAPKSHHNTSSRGSRNRVLDLATMCGVQMEGRACTRSLSCKQHSLMLKKAVEGRPDQFATLLAKLKNKLAASTATEDKSDSVRPKDSTTPQALSNRMPGYSTTPTSSLHSPKATPTSSGTPFVASTPKLAAVSVDAALSKMVKASPDRKTTPQMHSPFGGIPADISSQFSPYEHPSQYSTGSVDVSMSPKSKTPSGNSINRTGSIYGTNTSHLIDSSIPSNLLASALPLPLPSHQMRSPRTNPRVHALSSGHSHRIPSPEYNHIKADLMQDYTHNYTSPAHMGPETHLPFAYASSNLPRPMKSSMMSFDEWNQVASNTTNGYLSVNHTPAQTLKTLDSAFPMLPFTPFSVSVAQETENSCDVRGKPPQRDLSIKSLLSMETHSYFTRGLSAAKPLACKKYTSRSSPRLKCLLLMNRAVEECGERNTPHYANSQAVHPQSLPPHIISSSHGTHAMNAMSTPRRGLNSTPSSTGYGNMSHIDMHGYSSAQGFGVHSRSNYGTHPNVIKSDMHKSHSPMHATKASPSHVPFVSPPRHNSSTLPYSKLQSDYSPRSYAMSRNAGSESTTGMYAGADSYIGSDAFEPTIKAFSFESRTKSESHFSYSYGQNSSHPQYLKKLQAGLKNSPRPPPMRNDYNSSSKMNTTQFPSSRTGLHSSAADMRFPSSSHPIRSSRSREVRSQPSEADEAAEAISDSWESRLLLSARDDAPSTIAITQIQPRSPRKSESPPNRCVGLNDIDNTNAVDGDDGGDYDDFISAFLASETMEDQSRTEQSISNTNTTEQINPDANHRSNLFEGNHTNCTDEAKAKAKAISPNEVIQSAHRNRTIITPSLSITSSAMNTSGDVKPVALHPRLETELIHDVDPETKATVQQEGFPDPNDSETRDQPIS